MRLSTFASAALLALAPAALVAAQANDTPELGIVTTFPSNPGSIVKNGQPNTVVFSITNPPKEDRLLTLQSVTGAFLNLKKQDGQKGHVVRNMTTTAYKSRPLRAVGGKPVQIPFEFVPEFKPQEMGVEFSLLVNDEQTGKKHRIQAYRGSVHVIEPPKNWLDLQLLSVYVLGLVTLVGAGLFAYTSYFGSQAPAAKKPSRQQLLQQQQDAKKVDRPNLVKTKSGGEYEEDWIPASHLRARQTRASAAAATATALSSGDEEPTSPGGGRKQRKGRK